MAVKVGYRKEQLMMSATKCECGARHNALTQDVFVGAGLIDRLPEYISKRELGRICVLVADENTWAAAGERCAAALRDARMTVHECIIRRSGALVADERALGEVLMAMTMDTEFFISVGSGTVTDIVRTVAAKTERPFVAVATAPSTDGYVALSSDIVLAGKIVHQRAICPELVISDLDVLKNAPIAMFAAGVRGIIGNYTAKADWAIGHIARGEAFCQEIAQVVTGAANKVLKNIDEVMKRSEHGTKVLIESLLLGGMTVIIYGSARPVRGLEQALADATQDWLRGSGKSYERGYIVGLAALKLIEKYRSLAGDEAARDALPAPERTHIEAILSEIALMPELGRIEAALSTCEGSLVDVVDMDFVTDQLQNIFFKTVAKH